jgi:hypothetical protein
VVLRVSAARISVVGIVTMLQTGCSKNPVSFPAAAGNFFFLQRVGIESEPNQVLIHWAPRAVSSLEKRLEREADYSLLLPRLIMSGAVPPLSYITSWRVQRQLSCQGYFY